MDRSEIASKAAKARAAGMTQEQRSEAAKLAALSRWTDGGLETASHAGILRIGDLATPCYVLEEPGTPRRVLSAAGLIATLGMKPGSNPKIGGDRLSNFVAGKLISPFVSDELRSMIQNPIPFKTRGLVAYGYEAKVLALFCQAVLQLRRSGALQGQQQHIAERCEILQEGLSIVGIVALVDEATGYQGERARDALAKILEAYIAKELRPWVRTFPPDFYKHMFRLKGWPLPEDGNLKTKPMVVGHYTNDLVYARLAPGVREELRRTTPRDEKGRLKHHYHRKLTEDVGHPKLREHLAVVTAFMRVAKSWDDLHSSLDMACPKFGDNYVLPLEEA